MARRRKKASLGAGQIVLISLALLLIIIFIGFGIFLGLNREETKTLDKLTLCPIDGPEHFVSVLLDATDGISETTRLKIQKKLIEEKEKLKQFEQLAFYLIDESGLSKAPTSIICNPGSLSDYGKLVVEGITANPKFIEMREKAFDKKVKESINNLLDRDFESRQSPLLAAVQKISLMIPDKKSGKNKIILISDLLEHTEVFSVYRSNLDMKAFSKSRAEEKFGADLSNYDLHIWLIQRERFEENNLMAFWARILKPLMNTEVNFVLLPGEE